MHLSTAANAAASPQGQPLWRRFGVCILFLLVWVLWPLQTKAQPVLALSPHFGQVSLAGHWYASRPGHVPQDAAQALAQFQASQFEHIAGTLGRGFVAEDVWLAFQVELSPDSPQQSVILGLRPAMLDSVTIYTAKFDQAPVLAGQVGDQVAKTAQPLFASQPAQALTLTPGVATTVLLRVQTTSSQAVMASLYQPAEFADSQAFFHLLMGALITATGLMLVSSFILCVTQKQLRYLSWSAYVAVTAGLWLVIDGQAFFWFDWPDPAQINQLTTFLSINSLLVGAVFIAQMFEVQRIHPWLYRGLLIWAALVAAQTGIGMALNMGQLVALAILAGLPLLLGLPVIIAIQMVRRVPVAAWHGPLFILYLMAAGAHTLSAVGWAPYNALTFFGWQVLGAFNLASVQVFMLLQLHREQQRLLTDQNRYLNEQVTQRTHSLSEALAASQAAQARFKHLVDNSVDVVWRLNPDTLSFDYVSPLSSQHHRSLQSRQRVHPFGRQLPTEERERLERLVRARTAAFRAGEIGQGHVFFDEFLQTNAHGGRVPIESSCRFVIDAATGTLWLQGISRDATERKQMQRKLEQNVLQLRQTEAAQRQLLTTLSHEFRTPAAQIKASLDSLRLIQPTHPPEVQRRLDNIGAAAMRLSGMCTDLLTQERLQQHLMTAVKGPTDLCRLVHRVARMHPESARMQVLTPSVPLTHNVDAVLLTCALNNLLDNACAYATASITPITVTLQGGTSGATLRVADLGAGISNTEQERLFEKHHSGSGQFTRGLGLAIVRDIATAHGGHVHAENNHPNGTVFVLVLP